MILKRRSVRTYQPGHIEEDTLRELLDYAAEVTLPENLLGSTPVRFDYVGVPIRQMGITGASQYLVAIVSKTRATDEVLDIGRCLEKVMIRATRMGLGTVCCGGFGASKLIPLLPNYDEATDHIACLIPFGYAVNPMPRGEKLFRWLFRCDPRIPTSELFQQESTDGVRAPLSGDLAKKYETVLLPTSRAPSSINQQTTRIVSSSAGRMDFFATTTSRWYARINAGIRMANWELACIGESLPGHWEIDSERQNASLDDAMRYMATWVEDECAAGQEPVISTVELVGVEDEE